MTPCFAQIAAQPERQAIGLPSWATGNSGTPGTPRYPFEKIADAAQVHARTGLAPSVAPQIPWDKVDDYGDLPADDENHGVALGMIDSNSFQDEEHKFGSLGASNPTVLQCAIGYHSYCIDVMFVTGSRNPKIWLADGANYPGQNDIRRRQDKLSESLTSMYARLGDEQRLVVQYKFFELAFYHTDVLDWGTAHAQVAALGDKATVRLDTGHDATGTNIEFIAMQLLRLGKLGPFDLNSCLYADDDLIVGAANPFQLFRIMVEVLRGGAYDEGSDVGFMLDQCHNIEGKIPGQMRSVLNVQERTARALLVDRGALDAAQRANDVLAANAVTMICFYTDVRPNLTAWRESRVRPADPMAAYAASGYSDQIVAERIGGKQPGWGA